MSEQRISILLPDWLDTYAMADQLFTGDDAMIELAIALARENVQRCSGGPFGAAVFDLESGELIAAGVNLVVARRCSMLHAEMVALLRAEQLLGSHDLASVGHGRYGLATSVEPCSMCLGALHWAGIRRLICGATGDDAESVGFDEGPKPLDWPEALHARGITVVREVRRTEAAALLSAYRQSGGQIYVSRRTGPPCE